MTFSFYWHDYETWGADPSRDRAAQFAGVRTDADLQVIGKPLTVYCKPARDMLPHPEACLITGITPGHADAEGVCEAEFFSLIHQQLSQPGTCGVGYNSIRFDDEVTRYGFYRNFLDPYGREWQNGNSRWDIIDMVRVAHALRPEGIEWPARDDGTTSFRLERLSAANGIAHEGAHDALSDVYATLELARLIKDRQPRLFDYLLQLKDKRRVAQMLDLKNRTMMLHVSSKYPASRGCITIVAPVARHPTNSNGIVVYDLAFDPDPLLKLDADEIAQRLFTPRAQLPEGTEPVPLKTVHLNKSPAVMPTNTLTEDAAARWGIDVGQGEVYLNRIKSAAGLEQKIRKVLGSRQFDPVRDPDRSLYGGGFFSDGDRRSIQAVRETDPKALVDLVPAFQDTRLPEMLFRYRARNWPETLSHVERSRWEAFRRERLTDPAFDAGITVDEYRRRLAKMMVDPNMTDRDREILSELADWPGQLGIL
jgi:exodeoxyribonuclease-1